MRRATLAALALAPCAAMALQASSREWNFDVSLDGRRIGEHRYVLSQDGELRELTSEARFLVRVLFIDAYRYDHRARESWRGECLQRLDARTEVNGKRTQVEIDAPEGCVQTFAYWNPEILGARTLLNPQTGEYVAVEIRELGRELLDGQPVDRFRLVSSGRTPLQIDLWYTPSREWLALESLTPEGRRLRYSRK
jgi:hypothetical protein